MDITRSEATRMVADLQEAGVSFRQGRTKISGAEKVAERLLEGQDKVTVSGKQMRDVPVTSTADLAALSALHVTRQAAQLAHPALGTALLHLEAQDQKFYPSSPREGSPKPIGTYGAYRALTSGQELWMGPEIAVLSNPQDLQATSFFDFNGPADGLPRQDLALSLRQLETEGFHFIEMRGRERVGSEMSTRRTWEHLMEKPDAGLGVLVGGENVGTLHEKDLLDPSGLDPDIVDSVRFFELGLKPRVDSDDLYDQNAGVEVSEMLEFANGPLKARSADEADYHAERERLVQLCAAAGGFDVGRDCAELVGFEVGEPVEQRFSVMQELMSFEKGLGNLKGEIRDRDTGEKPLPGARAVNDYKLLLASRTPGQSLAEGAATLKAFHQAVAKHEGWQKSADAYVLIQKGVRQGRLPADAAQKFLASYLLHKDLDEAHAAARAQESSPGTVERQDDGLRIAGVRVPVREG